MTAPSVPWAALRSGADVADALCTLYEDHGADAYDEIVTQTEHALQCALLARAAGASDELVAAALLHDVGHLLLGAAEHDASGTARDLRHETVGARFLANWFPVELTEPVAMHVAAKRYLCAIESGYVDDLSPASLHSLQLQGGPMSPTEVAAWEQAPNAQDAIAVRRWDDQAKDPTIVAPPIRSFEPLLADLAHPHPAQ